MGCRCGELIDDLEMDLGARILIKVGAVDPAGGCTGTDVDAGLGCVFAQRHADLEGEAVLAGVVAKLDAAAMVARRAWVLIDHDHHVASADVAVAERAVEADKGLLFRVASRQQAMSSEADGYAVAVAVEDLDAGKDLGAVAGAVGTDAAAYPGGVGGGIGGFVGPGEEEGALVADDLVEELIPAEGLGERIRCVALRAVVLLEGFVIAGLATQYAGVGMERGDGLALYGRERGWDVAVTGLLGDVRQLVREQASSRRAVRIEAAGAENDGVADCVSEAVDVAGRFRGAVVSVDANVAEVAAEAGLEEGAGGPVERPA